MKMNLKELNKMKARSGHSKSVMQEETSEI